MDTPVMIILGITGAIGHGKSALAEALIKHEPKSLHLESYRIIADVSDRLHESLDTVPAAGDYVSLNKWLDKLPPVLEEVVGIKVKAETVAVREADIAKDPLAYKKLFQHLDALHINPELAKQTINDENKSMYRPILQWLGGYLVAKVSPSIWWDEIVRRSKKAEQEGIKLIVMGGVRFPGDARVVKAAGGKIILIKRPGLEESDIQDPTERERDQIRPDITVINDGSLDDLENCAKKLLNDIQSETTKEEYSCQNPNRKSSKPPNA